ncbi:MAG: hypothetical protein ABI068_15485, partial [Ktedonobacterales bacterium]
GDFLFGTATGIDDSGRLLVDDTPVGDSPRGSVHAVAAGDITHLRYE